MLRELLARMIHVGRLKVMMPGAAPIEVGEPPERLTGPDVEIRLRGRWTPLKLAVNPDLYLAEAYMAGDLVIERGDLWDLLELIGLNWTRRQAQAPADHVNNAIHRLGRIAQRSVGRKAARRNVAHHYDLSESLYRQFLDPDMQYSCAYFARPDMTLEEAQAAKKQHIIAKLRLEPGQHVLDIGSGWGGLALAIAESADVRVTGVTLSAEQLRVAEARADAAGLNRRVDFQLRDYREIDGPFDRIVSVGMFEHVGAASHAAFFESVRRLLAEDGLALVHSIGRRSPPAPMTGFIPKYIFPGGYIPSLSEVTRAVEVSNLWITDVEILRLHYAETLRQWRQRFLHASALVRDIYDEAFCRLWEFYLAGSEMAFRYGDLMVFQAQLTRRVEAAPLTRDYMFTGEMTPASQAARIAAQ